MRRSYSSFAMIPRTERGDNMEWELRHVDNVEAVLDDSGVYVVVHRIEWNETHKGYSGVRVTVRADLMQMSPPLRPNLDRTDEPIMSFQGSANAVRKALIRFWCPEGGGIRNPMSPEHASYIGYELLRAELTPGYVQD